MSHFPETMKEIKELQGFFVASLAQLQNGHITDMAGIDKRISEICKAAQSSTPEEQKSYLPELTILINLLNSYESELRRIQSSFESLSAKGQNNGDAT